MLLKRFIDFNPNEKLCNEQYRKFSMDMINPNTRKVISNSYEKYKGGSKFRNEDTLFARITPCLENGKTAYINCLNNNEVAFGSTEFIVARAIPNISLSLFVYYLLCSRKIRDIAIASMIGSSGRERVQQIALDNIEIPEYSLNYQQHIVDSIGSVDDAIEKNEGIIDKIYSFLTNKFNELVYGKNTISFGDLKYWNIVKSGIDKFEGNKIYIDTSSVSNKSIIDTSYNITYDDRPSRANMQPIPNTVWFAKLKDSPKFIIVKNLSKRILNNYVFSTGFMGLEADDYIINYLYLLILSSNFNNQKDASSTGATMMGINNDILYSIKVPNITKGEAYSFGKEIDNFIETIVSLQEKNYILKLIKKNLLSKYFD